ncbi:MAG: HD domain-containing protein [Alphaproteobacteria bacterium]|nr:HD domain-containing protein [Alphaproteobacteria bacterium]MDP6812781.1 HD domain-containing protein [Alphaproteobacteria bacterium]
MKDGDADDYRLLDRHERDFAAGTADRVLAALAELEHSLSGYQVSRLEHSLQTASRAERDGADREMVVTALLHDIGDGLAPWNHGALAAAILQPYVREECVWIAAHHGIFQKYYYAHHLDGDRHQRERHRDHPHYEACRHFCEAWDQASFDPDYDTLPLEHFAPVVRQLFSR